MSLSSLQELINNLLADERIDAAAPLAKADLELLVAMGDFLEK